MILTKVNTEQGDLRALKQAPRLPLLDVLRVLALLQVSVFHQHARLLQSGYLAVLTFFMLSAYLLFRAYLWRRFYSHLELSASYPKQKISLQNCDESIGERFSRLLRQLTKLYLPFIAMIFSVSLLLLIFYPEYLAKQAATLRASLLGVNNYQQLWQGQSYFRGAGFLSAFTHIWALSVEWQYYLVLFLLLIPLYQNMAKWRFRRLCLLVASLSQILLWLAAIIPSFSERAYFASFSRSLPFFVGCFLAASFTAYEYKFVKLLYFAKVYRDEKLFYKAVGTFKLSPFASTLLATGSLSVLLLLPFLELNLKQFYLWQNLLYTLALAIFIFASLNLEMLAKLKASANFNWRKKYGSSLVKLTVYAYHFYLWHFPIQAIITKASANLTWSVWLFDFTALIISALVSYGSYVLTFKLEKKLNRTYIGVICLILAFILFFIPYSKLGSAKQQALDSIAAKINDYEKQTEAIDSTKNNQTEAKAAETEQVEQVDSSLNVQANELDPKDLPLTDNVLSDTDRQHLALFEAKMLNIMQANPELKFNLRDFENLRLQKYTMLGDSIGIFLSFFVEYYLPNTKLDVRSVRRMVEAKQVYEQAKQDGKLGEAVIALFGTNGIIQVQEVEDLYKLAQQDKKPLFLATVVLPWADQENENNTILRKFVEEHENCYLIDWHKYAKNNASYFEADSIHPSASGCELYMHLICKSLVEAFNK